MGHSANAVGQRYSIDPMGARRGGVDAWCTSRGGGFAEKLVNVFANPLGTDVLSTLKENIVKGARTKLCADEEVTRAALPSREENRCREKVFKLDLLEVALEGMRVAADR